MKQLKISCEQLDILISKLIAQIKESGIKFDGVYGVPRGGNAIALWMSHKLNLPILMSPTNESLVVDDISDTGVSLQYIKNKKIATLFSTDWTITKPDWFVDKKLNKEEWIVFPWENEDEGKQTTIEAFIN